MIHTLDRGWSKAAPYYVNESCKAGAWELKLLCDFTQLKISSIYKEVLINE